MRRPAPPPLSRPPLQRMLTIHDALRRHRNPTRRVLATRMDVSTKTIQRDIDFMRDHLGLPIAFDPERNGYRYVQPVEQFPTIEITAGELVALMVGRKALALYRGTPYERALRVAFDKLTRPLTETVTFEADAADRSISFRAMGLSAQDIELFERVSQALLDRRELEFRYRKLGSRIVELRQVRPYHLACIDQQWYLFAFDLQRRQIRTFSLARMADARATSRRFERPADFSLGEFLGESFGVFRPARPGRPCVVELEFDAFAARLVTERLWHSSQHVQPRRGGGAMVSFRLAGFEEIRRWILGWGEHVRVVRPAALRAEIAAVGRRVAENNA